MINIIKNGAFIVMVIIYAISAYQESRPYWLAFHIFILLITFLLIGVWIGSQP